MGRRTRMRRVKRTPRNFYFTRNAQDVNSIDITVAEFEAMRLKHYVGMNQQTSAKKMNISQPTFSRILDSAHQKVTRALIEGKAIRVAGGNVVYKRGFVGYGCMNCDNEWEDEEASKDRKATCPECGSEKVYYLEREPV
ncbi:MAG: DUF134 domain-containing protein [Promethearchaeia archaeon]